MKLTAKKTKTHIFAQKSQKSTSGGEPHEPNSGKVLCEENKIADTVYSNKSQKSITGG